MDKAQIRETIAKIFDTYEKLPSMKGKLSQLTGGVLECEKLELDLHGASTVLRNGTNLDDITHLRAITMPTCKAKIVIRCKEGTLGQLGWDKKKLLDMFDYLTKEICKDDVSKDQIGRMCDEVAAFASKFKIKTKADDPRLGTQLKKLRELQTNLRNLVNLHAEVGRSYTNYLSKVNVAMVKLRNKLKKIPDFIVKHVDVGAMATIGAYAAKQEKKNKK